jgi:hypothetical protein
MEVTLRTRKRQFWFSKTVTAALSTPPLRTPCMWPGLYRTWFMPETYAWTALDTQV